MFRSIIKYIYKRRRMEWIFTILTWHCISKRYQTFHYYPPTPTPKKNTDWLYILHELKQIPNLSVHCMQWPKIPIYYSIDIAFIWSSSNFHNVLLCFQFSFFVIFLMTEIYAFCNFSISVKAWKIIVLSLSFVILPHL